MLRAHSKGDDQMNSITHQRWTRKRNDRGPSSRLRHRPSVEQLEDRRLLSTGVLPDPMFGSNGIVTTDFGATADGANVTVVQGDGRIIAAGASRPTGTSDQSFALTRYNLDGSLDPNFGTGGKV